MDESMVQLDVTIRIRVAQDEDGTFTGEVAGSLPDGRKANARAPGWPDQRSAVGAALRLYKLQAFSAP